MTPASTMRLLILSFVLLVCAGLGQAQTNFEIVVDSSATMTQLATATGHGVKFLATDTRLVALDYENSRILLYARGTTFDNSVWIATIGEHSLPRDNAAFNPASQPRVNSDFTAELWHDTLWVINYSFGEIVRFTLNGKYIDSRPSKMRLLDNDGTSLYGLAGDSIYVLNPSTLTFTAKAMVPQKIAATNESYGANIRIGSDRLLVRDHNVVRVYNLTKVLAGGTADSLFTIAKGDTAITDAEIVGNKIVWSYDYTTLGSFGYSDLNGANRGTGAFNLYTYSMNYSNKMLYVVGASALDIVDSSMTVTVTSRRFLFMAQLRLLGADDKNLFFFEGQYGGVLVAPIDFVKGQYHMNMANKIYVNAFLKTLHIRGTSYSLLTQNPSGNGFTAYALNLDSMKAAPTALPATRGFDVVSDTLIDLSTTKLQQFSRNGTLLSSSVLAGIDSTSDINFAANSSSVFVATGKDLRIYGRNGVFVKSYPFANYPASGRIFADDKFVYSSAPPQILNIGSGAVTSFQGTSIQWGGVMAGKRYWYNSDAHNMKYVEPSAATAVAQAGSGTPLEFALGQNYPNPFNPSSTITFTLAQAGAVQLTVYDVLGRQVAQPVNDTRIAGTYSVQIDGSHLASGVYMFRLTSAGQTLTKKMSLVK